MVLQQRLQQVVHVRRLSQKRGEVNKTCGNSRKLGCQRADKTCTGARHTHETWGSPRDCAAHVAIPLNPNTFMSCVVLRMHRMGPEPSALSRSAAARRRTSGLTPAAPPSSMSSSTKFAEGSSCLSARTCCFDIDRAPKRPQPPQQRPCCTPSRRKKALCLQVAGAFALRLLRRGRGRQARTGRWRHGGAPPQQPRRAKPTGAVQTRGRRGTGRFGGAQSGTRSTVIHPFYSVVHPAALAPASPPLAVSPGARDKCSDGLQQRGTLNIPATDGQHPTRKNEGEHFFLWEHSF